MKLSLLYSIAFAAALSPTEEEDPCVQKCQKLSGELLEPCEKLREVNGHDYLKCVCENEKYWTEIEECGKGCDRWVKHEDEINEFQKQCKGFLQNFTSLKSEDAKQSRELESKTLTTASLTEEDSASASTAASTTKKGPASVSTAASTTEKVSASTSTSTATVTTTSTSPSTSKDSAGMGLKLGSLVFLAALGMI